MKTTQKQLELGVSIALFALAVFVVVQSARMPSGTLSLPGPGMLPMALGIILGLTSVALILRAARPGAGRPESLLLGNRQIATVLVALLVAGLLFERVGFFVTGVLFLLILLWQLSPLGWLRALITAVAATAVMEQVFLHVLGVSLPPFPWRF